MPTTPDVTSTQPTPGHKRADSASDYPSTGSGSSYTGASSHTSAGRHASTRHPTNIFSYPGSHPRADPNPYTWAVTRGNRGAHRFLVPHARNGSPHGTPLDGRADFGPVDLLSHDLLSDDRVSDITSPCPGDPPQRQALQR